MTMRKKIFIIVAVILIYLFVSYTQIARQPVGKITFPLNRVFVLRAGSSQLQMAYFNMEVYEGDKIETKKESRCEITLRNGDVIRIDENSIYTLEKIELKEKVVKAESFLNVGKLWSNIKKIFSKSDYFRVKSPTAIIAVRGTVYRMNALPDSSLEVYVYKGQVQVSPYRASMGMQQQGRAKVQKPQQVPGPTVVKGPTEVSMETWLEIVKAQQQLIIHPDGSFEKKEFDPQEDARLEWVQWNLRRDQLLEQKR